MKFLLTILIACLLSQVQCGIRSIYKLHKYAINSLEPGLTDEVKFGKIVGDVRQIDKNDLHVSELLGEHLGRLITGDNSKFVIDKIDEVSRQTVAGMSYRVKGHYIVEGVPKDCTVNILERPWYNNEEKVIISAKCDDGSCYVTESYICSPKSLKTLLL